MFLGLSVWVLHVLPVPVWVLYRYFGFLTQSKNMQARLTGDFKVAVDVRWIKRSKCIE